MMFWVSVSSVRRSLAGNVFCAFGLAWIAYHVRHLDALLKEQLTALETIGARYFDEMYVLCSDLFWEQEGGRGIFL